MKAQKERKKKEKKEKEKFSSIHGISWHSMPRFDFSWLMMGLFICDLYFGFGYYFGNVSDSQF